MINLEQPNEQRICNMLLTVTLQIMSKGKTQICPKTSAQAKNYVNENGVYINVTGTLGMTDVEMNLAIFRQFKVNKGEYNYITGAAVV